MLTIKHLTDILIEVVLLNINFEMLGKRIAHRRHELGIKQCIAAEKIDISNNYLSNIENGKSIPSLETFANICSALSTTPDFFLLGTMKTNNIPQNIIDNLKLCNENSLNLLNDIIQSVLNNQENK